MSQAEAFAALVAAQAEMKNAHLNKTNPHFKSKYADLSSVREATMPALAKHGLGILQKPTLKDGRFVLVSRLIHKSGVVVDECEYPLTVEGKPQQVGSEITYARRYTWAALCGISADEDDDANAAQEAPRQDSGKVNAEQAKAIRDLLVEVGADEAKYLQYMKVDSIEDIPASRYADAVAALMAKKRKDAA